jgi:DNA-binding transcriptional LysR family regulator
MGTVDLNLLEIFVAVADTGSFSAAARRLGVPKSSVSRGVASLEKALKLRLLHRTTRHVSTSTAGAALRERVAPLLGSLAKAVCALPELEEAPAGHLRLTTTLDLGASVLAEIVASFVQRFPSITVEMKLTNAVVDIVAEGFDAAFRISARPLRDSSLAARKIGPLSGHLYAAPTYLARRGTPRTPADLAEHDWVGFRAGEPLVLEGPGEKIVPPRPHVTCDEMTFAREVIKGGAGIGVVPDYLVEDDVAAGRLARVLGRWSLGSSGSVWLVTPSAENAPRKLTAFRDFAIEAFKSRPLG